MIGMRAWRLNGFASGLRELSPWSPSLGIQDEEEDVSMDMVGQENEDEILLKENTILEISLDDYVENGIRTKGKEASGIAHVMDIGSPIVN
ncbi:hypothetical protein L1987_09505 [Smallanthus sonchifolius]|uniref:Uncharacterized protein n=1 Tax=Smallanthus sonchifolius TaxID=185202 RepID=A0ACB9JP06_9ASTR|nr:hypothetical protein L1987_09505 [Smallanthus sonchifolius]